jgi:hypothetical protein
MKIMRQGDVLLIKIKKIPTDLKSVSPTKKGFILAEGEATGHHHAIKETESVEMYAANDSPFLYLIVKEPTKLEHEEHDAIELPLGKYKVVRQREYYPGEIRTVLD